MFSRSLMPKVATSTLIFALLSTLIAFIPVEKAAAAALDITTYPQIRVNELREIETLTAASYNATTQLITYTTGTKNLFAYEKEVGGNWGMWIQITGMVNNGAGCDRNQYAGDSRKYDGFNSPIDSITVTSITPSSPSAGFVTYTTNLTPRIGEIQVGETVYISGATHNPYNETKTVTSVSVSGSNYSFSVKSSASGTSSGATAKHTRWEEIISADDNTVTIARNPGSSCTASATAASTAIARESGPDIEARPKATNMATDKSGSLIFMSTGTYPHGDEDGRGNLYISRNSGRNWNKVDLSDQNGVSLGNVGIANLAQSDAAAPYQFKTLYGCQHRVCGWTSVGVSHDGMTLAAASMRGQLVYSQDGGYSWKEVSREHMKRCDSDQTGMKWKDIRVTKDGKKIIAYDSHQGNLMTLDLNQAVTINLSAKPPSNLGGYPGCSQSFYTTQTNPSFYSTHSTDAANIPSDLRSKNDLYGMAINKDGTRMFLTFGGQGAVICTGTGRAWTKCVVPPAPRYPDNTPLFGSFGTGYNVAAFMSASGQYITVAGFQNYIFRSIDYGASFQIVSDAPRTTSGQIVNTYTYGGSNASVSACGDPAGVASIAGSDDGKVQYFVTRNTQQANIPPANTKMAITPGVCKSTNYGAKGSWSPIKVALTAGGTVDISRKQVFTTVVTGSTGTPVYFGSSGVNLAQDISTCEAATATSCSPNFWSNFSITGPPSVGTPVGTPITAQIYSTVNPPSGSAATIVWDIKNAIGGAAVPGITISQEGLVNVSGSVAEGSYQMTITATDAGTPTTLNIFVYVYDPNRPVPTYDTPVRTATGYTVNVTNYNSKYVYTPKPDTGTVAVGVASGSILPITLSGVLESTTVTISVDSYMGTYDTDIFGLKNSSVTGISKWTQTTLAFANSLFVGKAGSRTLLTSGGSGSGAITYVVTTAGTAGCSINNATSTLTVTSTTIGHTCQITATKAEDTNYVARSTAITTMTVRESGKVPTFGSPIRTATGYQVAITNYDAAFTWNITTNRGSLSIGTPVGSTETLTITSLNPGESATITVGTTRATYSDETGTVLSFSISNLTITANNVTTTVGRVRTQGMTILGLTGSDSITSVTYEYAGINGTTFASSNTRPTTAGEYSVTPSAGVFGTGTAANYNISYVAGVFVINSAPTIGGGSNISTVFNTPASSTAFTVTGGTGTIRFTITGALSGVSIDSVTGVVTVTGSSPIPSNTVNVVATDELGITATGPITIEVTLGASSIILSFPAAGNYPTKKATTVVITATVASAGKVSFTANKRKVAGCTNLRTINFVATCSWKPTSHGYIFVLANFVPDDVNQSPASAQIYTTPTQRTSPR